MDLGNAARLREGAPDGTRFRSRERRFLSGGCGGTAKDRRGCRSGMSISCAADKKQALDALQGGHKMKLKFAD